ncbi:MAG: alpha/beta fold hydrolase [Candidatus Zixiibacteriota bacterium]
MPFAHLGNYKLYYEEYLPPSRDSSSSGEKSGQETALPPLIFLHGFTLDRRMWQPQVNFFSRFYRVILLDSRGHGLSDAPETGYSRADRVNDLRKFVEYLEIRKFHLIGLSMGGSTAIGYALKNQDRLASLTLISTGAAGFDVGKKIARIDQIARQRGLPAAFAKWKQATLTWFSNEQKAIRELMERMIDEHSGAIWLDPMRGRYQREDDLKQVHIIKVPTIIFAGAADRVFLSLARQLHERIPNSRLSIYEGVGHMVNLEAAERFNAELAQFLQSCTANV